MFFSIAPDYMDKDKKILEILSLLAKNHTGLPEAQLKRYPLYLDAYKAFDELIYSSLILQQKEMVVDIFKGYKRSENTSYLELLTNFSKINEKAFVEKISDQDQAVILPGSVYEIKIKNALYVPDKPMNGKSIAIELTPPCDFSHKKIISKLVGGFIIELPDEKKNLKKQ